MRKKFVFVFILVLALQVLVGCSAGIYNNDAGEDLGGGDGQSVIVATNNRKIIYTANLSVKSKDLLKTTNEVKGFLLEDEWVESESLTSNSNAITLRVKTDHLNAFIAQIRSDYETTNFKLDSKDVSLDYLDASARKESLESERRRLVELYEEATIHEMITIESRISDIDTELIKLERRLLEFDSLVDYSTVHIWIYGPTADPNPPSYGTRLSNTIKMGWKTVVAIVQGLFQSVVFLIPFLVILVPVGGTVFGIIYYKRKKKSQKEEK